MNVRCTVLVAAAAAVMFFRLAHSEDTNTSSSKATSTQLQEVVVTAEKRQESLTKAPLAVTALSQQQLTEAGVEGLQSITSTAPDVEVRTAAIANAIQVTIRGITNTDFNEAANPAVATYVDGVYVGRGEGLAGDFYDLARVEVLRGPQGTLYGLNSTGGNVNIITAGPENAFDAAADISYGNYGDVQTHGMVNIPVSDTLAIRGAFVVHRNNGYFNTEGTTAQNYEAADDYGERLTGLWTPTNTLKWRLSVSNFVSNGTPALSIATGPDGKPVDGLPVFDRLVSDNPEQTSYISNLLVRSKLDWQTSDTTSLTYIAGYQNVKSTPQTVIGTVAGVYTQRPSQNYSHEIDFNLDLQRFHNILGATYFHQNYLEQGSIDFFTTNTAFQTHAAIETRAWGAFDQATYSFTDSLRVIAGVRDSSESIDANGARQIYCPLTLYPPSVKPLDTLTGFFFGPGCSEAATAGNGTGQSGGSWSHVDWKAGLQYDVSDSVASYLTVTTGFKSGGLNLGAHLAPSELTFLPETVTNYELGIKTRLLDDRLSLNTALFYEDYRNIQVTQVDVVDLADVTNNAAKARIYGLETEWAWRLTAADRLSGFLNYLNARYTDYKNAVDQLTGDIVPDLSGHHLPHSPPFSARLQYSHDFTLSNGGTLTPMVATYWQQTSYLREFNFAIDRVPGYTKTDAALTYENPTGNWTMAAYVNNAENNTIRNGSFTFFQYFSDYDPPRTYGVRVAYKY